MKIVDYLIIGDTIRIGQEILCLPYAGFNLLLKCTGSPDHNWDLHNHTKYLEMFSVFTSCVPSKIKFLQITALSFIQCCQLSEGYKKKQSREQSV